MSPDVALHDVELQAPGKDVEQRPQTTAPYRYRADIDGLRAIAVLLVVFDHLRTRFKGGYIGVDVFFVISGYLISSVIISEMTSNRFSLIDFYERRIRRILPALMATILATALLVYRYFVPSDTVSFAWSALAAQFSVSNLFFLKGSGYFAPSSAFMPLLHTWSLSVEEQFYIFFPIFLVFVRRWHPRRLKASIWLIAIISLCLASACVVRDSSFAFFLAPLRAWELLLGTIVSQRYLPAIRGVLFRNTASLAGLALVLVPALIYRAETPFPGLAAVPPCLGAALIIAAGETGTSLVGNLLGFRPVAFVGLISYSLYLWHWPILVFQHTSNMLVDTPIDSTRAKIAVFLVSLAIAVLSWRFIETPFRKGPFRPNRRVLFWMTGSAFATVSLLAVSMIASSGFSSRFTGEALAVSRYSNFDPAVPYRANSCFLDVGSKFNQFTPDICLPERHAPRQILLLGDSHGAQMYPGLAATFPEIDISEATVAQCRPLVRMRPDSALNCARMSSYIYEDYLPRHHVDTVLLGGRWEEKDIPDMERTVSWIQQHGMEVVVFGPNIEFDMSLPRILAFSIRNGKPSDVLRHRLGPPELLDQKLSTLVRGPLKARYISMYEDLCSRQPYNNGNTAASALVCPTKVGFGVPLLFDTDHLTPEASIYFAQIIKARHQLP